MRAARVSMPQLGLIAATRGALGAGLGLLLGQRLGPERRQKVGWGLVALGVASTVPLAIWTLRRSR